MRIETAIVLAGGKGTRLKGLTSDVSSPGSDVPKPMIKIAGKPILEHNLEWLKKHGVKKVVIGVAYKKEKIIQYFGNGIKFGLDIVYSEHSTEDSTGDAFRKAIKNANLNDRYFYSLNGDQLTDFPLKKLFNRHIDKKQDPPPLATILLVHPTCPFGIVETDENNWVTSFKEKPKLEKWSNGGIYVFDRNIKDYLNGDVERVTFVKLAQERKLQSFFYTGFWDTVNTYKDLIRVKELFEGGGVSL